MGDDHGLHEVADLRQATLDQEKAADEKLSELAEGGINLGATGAAHADDDEEPVGVAVNGARKSSAKTRRR